MSHRKAYASIRRSGSGAMLYRVVMRELPDFWVEALADEEAHFKTEVILGIRVHRVEKIIRTKNKIATGE